MSNSYNIEPPPTAFATLHTTAGPISFSLFAQQAPLACRNFLQHILDGYYDNTSFHRVVPGFVIQGGDPTGTGEGGASIYEDAEFENDPVTGEKIEFHDELHTRLRFNRRGLLGMAKMTDAQGKGSYGSQFFITLADCRAELDGKCTMFGRVEGEGIYNVVKIADAELVEGTERPVWPAKVTRAEVEEFPKGDIWQGMKKRERIASKTTEDKPAIKTKSKKKAGKVLLSFGDEEEEEGPVVMKKAKFNTSLIDDKVAALKEPVKANGHSKQEKSTKKSTRQRHSASPSPPPVSRSPEHHRKPSLHDSTTQLPLKDPESPSKSPSPDPSPKKSLLSETNAQIAALKASMRRDVTQVAEPKKKKSALEQMIPETSVRGRKRRHDGAPADSAQDSDALRMLNAFKARLEGVDSVMTGAKEATNGAKADTKAANGSVVPSVDADDEEAQLCDLHFIANCQSCSSWDQDLELREAEDNGEDKTWMSHALSFEKDRLGKDLNWKRKNEEELVVIDPREKERELKSKNREKRDGGGTFRGKGMDREWDRRRT